jgi:hypothetical protein
MPVFGTDQFNADILGVLAAALPGVFIALFAQYLAQRHEAQVERRLNANLRLAVASELDRNRDTLDAFWKDVNALDATPQQDGAEAHLARMYDGGLLDRVFPTLSFTRWEGLPPQAFAALDAKEAAVLDQGYRDLRSIAQLYTRLVTLTSDERAEFAKGGSAGRFWYNYLSGWRIGTFQQLDRLVQRVRTVPALPARPSGITN